MRLTAKMFRILTCLGVLCLPTLAAADKKITEKDDEGLELGVKAPPIVLRNLDGKLIKLSQYIGSGKFTIIDFWATYCIPCKTEMPMLEELQGR